MIIKYLVLSLFCLLIISSVSATLSQEQRSMVFDEIKIQLPSCQDNNGIYNLIDSQNCQGNTINSPVSFSCGDYNNHSYVCRMGIPYLDDVPLLVEKNEFVGQKYDTSIQGSNINLGSSGVTQSIDNSQQSTYFNLTFTIAISLISLLSITINIFQFIKNRRKQALTTFRSQV